MRWSTGGLLAVVGAAMSALGAFAHSDLIWTTVVDATLVTNVSLAALLALPDKKVSPKSANSDMQWFVRLSVCPFLGIVESAVVLSMRTIGATRSKLYTLGVGV